jgi:hypothetical protein
MDAGDSRRPNTLLTNHPLGSLSPPADPRPSVVYTGTFRRCDQRKSPCQSLCSLAFRLTLNGDERDGVKDCVGVSVEGKEGGRKRGYRKRRCLTKPTEETRMTKAAPAKMMMVVGSADASRELQCVSRGPDPIDASASQGPHRPVR